MPRVFTVADKTLMGRVPWQCHLAKELVMLLIRSCASEVHGKTGGRRTDQTKDRPSNWGRQSRGESLRPPVLTIISVKFSVYVGLVVMFRGVVRFVPGRRGIVGRVLLSSSSF